MKRLMFPLAIVASSIGCASGPAADDSASSESAVIGDGFRSPESVMADLVEYQPFVGQMSLPGGRPPATVKLVLSARESPANAGTSSIQICNADLTGCSPGDGSGAAFAFTLDRSASLLWYNLNLRQSRDDSATRTHSIDYQTSAAGQSFGGLVPTIKIDASAFSVLIPQRFYRAP